jgi:hypothetical protein
MRGSGSGSSGLSSWGDEEWEPGEEEEDVKKGEECGGDTKAKGNRSSRQRLVFLIPHYPFPHPPYLLYEPESEASFQR